MENNQNNLNVGEESVVIGNVRGNVGNHSVIVGATDSHGNTILNQPMAVGYNAKAGPGSIAIGAYAGAGSDGFLLLNELKEIIKQNGDEKTLENIINLIGELKKPNIDKTKVSQLWENIKSVTTITNAIASITQISLFIAQIIK